MTAIRWRTLVADVDGTIDYVRLRAFVSVLLGLSGGLLVLAAGAVELRGGELHTDVLMLAAGALIVPLTGGRIADGLSGRLASRRIQAGSQVGRRQSDAAVPPPDEAEG